MVSEPEEGSTFFCMERHNIGIQNGERYIFVGLTSHFSDVYEI